MLECLRYRPEAKNGSAEFGLLTQHSCLINKDLGGSWLVDADNATAALLEMPAIARGALHS